MKNNHLAELSLREQQPALAFSVNGGSLSPRDLVAIGFRHWRLALSAGIAVLLGFVLVVPVRPHYRSTMKILVKRDRLESAATTQIEPRDVTVADLNSEAELLKSEDLLRSVVLESELVRSPQTRDVEQQNLSVARAVRDLRDHLIVDPIGKSNLIEIEYESSDARLAAHVLDTMAQLYLEKHLAVHGTPGQSKFFQAEAERYRQEMEAAQSKLADAAVAPRVSRDLTLQKLSDFTATLGQTQTAFGEAKLRIAALQRRQATLPPRITTQLRRTDNQQLLQQLKTTLLNLKLKRTDLLSKYQPTYRPVIEVQQQIEETEATLKAEQTKPAGEEVTDQNPTYLWTQNELAKATVDLKALEGRARGTERNIANLQAAASRLGRSTIAEQELERTLKVAEETYLLYRRMGEDARIADAMDARRMLNVSVAQSAFVPAFPEHSHLYYLLFALTLACLGALGMIILVEYFDPYLRTSQNVTASLNIPVLALLPKPSCDLQSSPVPSSGAADREVTRFDP